jgi:hypothetical protein
MVPPTAQGQSRDFIRCDDVLYRCYPVDTPASHSSSRSTNTPYGCTSTEPCYVFTYGTVPLRQSTTVISLDVITFESCRKICDSSYCAARD